MMKRTELVMGMPVIVEIADAHADSAALGSVFEYFRYVDEKFSTYKSDSEISKINRHALPEQDWSADMREVFRLAEKTKLQTENYFDIRKPDGQYDPSGLVKGWAIRNAARLLRAEGFRNFYINAGGDIETSGSAEHGAPWTVGIKNPFNTGEIVKVLEIGNGGIATSGNYLRGNHIYNPKEKEEKLEEVSSLTVIGPDIYEADRFATAAFAMGKSGIVFIESLPGFEGYMIDCTGMATMTSGFERYAK
ncbi:MAG: FAD:protein FMN transferase [bacterium]